MSYDQDLAERVRRQLARSAGLAPADVMEKPMFGCMGFFIHENLCVAVRRESLVARLGPEQAEPALELEHVNQFQVGGRPMKGWVLIAPEGLEEDDSLRDWIKQAHQFVATLPPK